MNAVDTNILLYVRDPRDLTKQQEAISLTTSLRDGVLLWQVACEFVAASRKLALFGFTQEQAWRELEKLRALWHLVLPSGNVLYIAEGLTMKHGVSFWDPLIIASCIEGGVSRLYTEDFDNSLSRATGIEIVNPFEG